MSFKITGMDQLQKKLRDLSTKAKALDGSHSVPLTELFPPAFLQKHTQFASLEEMFAKSGFKVETPEDFKAIPDDQWDKFISQHTKFKNWHEMQEHAAAGWTKKKLGL